MLCLYVSVECRVREILLTAAAPIVPTLIVIFRPTLVFLLLPTLRNRAIFISHIAGVVVTSLRAPFT
jgi:hypothetical protein